MTVLSEENSAMNEEGNKETKRQPKAPKVTAIVEVKVVTFLIPSIFLAP